MKKLKKGFTLIEMIVSVTILGGIILGIGIMVDLSVTSYNNKITQGIHQKFYDDLFEVTSMDNFDNVGIYSFEDLDQTTQYKLENDFRKNLKIILKNKFGTQFPKNCLDEFKNISEFEISTKCSMNTNILVKLNYSQKEYHIYTLYENKLLLLQGKLIDSLDTDKLLSDVNKITQVSSSNNVKLINFSNKNFTGTLFTDFITNTNKNIQMDISTAIFRYDLDQILDVNNSSFINKKITIGK